jgi:hypothetical protein
MGRSEKCREEAVGGEEERRGAEGTKDGGDMGGAEGWKGVRRGDRPASRQRG